MSVRVAGAISLAEVRAVAASALAPATDTDPDVIPGWSDSVSPPAVMLGWSAPWITEDTVAGPRGLFEARLNVQCVASRVDPEAGLEELESVVAYAVSRLPWPLLQAQQPQAWESGGIPLLGADLVFSVRVAIEEV